MIIGVELANVLMYHPVGFCYEVSGSQTFASNYDLWLNNKKGFSILSATTKPLIAQSFFQMAK